MLAAVGGYTKEEAPSSGGACLSDFVLSGCMRTTYGPADDPLLHQKKVTSLLDYLGDVPLLQGGEPGYAARKDFTRVCYEAGQDLNVVMREFKRILLALFLGCHKRQTEGLLNFHGKEKVQIPHVFCHERQNGIGSCIR